ncbi:MAG: hypothetical protein K5675_00435 [Lachnospiraceae bacterium]|nr:hypothetical protein [Lachnospiraceae bacterium]
MKELNKVICGIYILVVVLLLPLYVENNYFNILEAKRNVFWMGAVICIVLMVVSASIKSIFMMKEREKYYQINIKSIIRDISFMDIAVVGYVITVFVSAVCSEWKKDAFTGNMGYYVGALFILAVVLLYFFISRQNDYSDNVWLYMFIASFLVVLLGILNRMRIDPFSMHDNLTYGAYFYWLSTVGNTDYYHAFLSIIIAVFLSIFPSLDKKWERVAVQILLIMGYLGIYIASASSVFAGLGVFALFAIYVSLSDKIFFTSLLKQGIIFSFVGVIADLLYHFSFDKVANFDNETICVLILDYHLYVLVGVLSCIFLIVLRFRHIQNIFNHIKKMYPWFIVSGFVLLIGWVIVEPNFDIWFTRTPVWRFAIEGFERGDWRERLIGYGPCCCDYMIFKHNLNADGRIASMGFLYDTTGFKFQTLHSELMDGLCTIGIVGVGFYVAIWGSLIIDIIKNNYKDKVQLWLMAGLMAYLGQSASNGPHPMLFPLGFLFLALYRNIELKKSESLRK